MKAIITLIVAFVLSGLHVEGQHLMTWEDVPDIVASIRSPEVPGRVYSVADYGGLADGRTDSRPAIMKAISKANKEGGGKVILDKGTWFVKGPIHLRSNVELHFEKGARLKFSGNPD